MDYRNDNRTPRDRVDEEFFRSILRSEDNGDNMHARSRSRMNNSSRTSNMRINEHGNNSNMRMNEHGNNRSMSSQRDSSQYESSQCDGFTQGNALAGFPLGMVYSPAQSFTNIMEPEMALKNGTIFCELNMPFYHSGCRGGMCK